MHVAWAERVGGNGRREGRVDPAGDADDDVGEAVLADVVTEAQPEPEPHLLELTREGHDRRRERLAGLARRSKSDRRRNRRRRSRALQLAPTHIPEPSAD